MYSPVQFSAQSVWKIFLEGRKNAVGGAKKRYPTFWLEVGRRSIGRRAVGRRSSAAVGGRSEVGWAPVGGRSEIGRAPVGGRSEVIRAPRSEVGWAPVGGRLGASRRSIGRRSEVDRRSVRRRSEVGRRSFGRRSVGRPFYNTIIDSRLPLVMWSRKAGLPFATRARKRELSIQKVRIENESDRKFKKIQNRPSTDLRSTSDRPPNGDPRTARTTSKKFRRVTSVNYEYRIRRHKFVLQIFILFSLYTIIYLVSISGLTHAGCASGPI